MEDKCPLLLILWVQYARDCDQEATVDSLAKNMASMSLFEVELDYQVSDGTTRAVLDTCYAFLLFFTLESTAIIGVCWVEFFPSVKLHRKLENVTEPSFTKL